MTNRMRHASMRLEVMEMLKKALEQALWKTEGMATWADVGQDYGLTAEEAVEEVANYILSREDAVTIRANLADGNANWLSDWINRWAAAKGGEWLSRNIRIGMTRAQWQRVLEASERMPGRSQAEKLGNLLLLGVSLLQQEGKDALTRLLE